MRRLFSMRALFLALLVFLVPAVSRAQVSVGVSDTRGTPGFAGIRAAGLSGGGLPVDAGVLGVRR